MAQLTFTITVPDVAVPRIMSALRSHFGQVQDPPDSGIFRDMTDVELRERFRALVRDTLKNMVLNQEIHEATQTVRADVTALPIT